MQQIWGWKPVWRLVQLSFVGCLARFGLFFLLPNALHFAWFILSFPTSMKTRHCFQQVFMQIFSVFRILAPWQVYWPGFLVHSTFLCISPLQACSPSFCSEKQKFFWIRRIVDHFSFICVPASCVSFRYSNFISIPLIEFSSIWNSNNQLVIRFLTRNPPLHHLNSIPPTWVYDLMTCVSTEQKQ